MTPAPDPKVAELVARLRRSAKDFDRPPSIQSMEHIRAIDAMNEAATALERLGTCEVAARVLVQWADDNGYDRFGWRMTHSSPDAGEVRMIVEVRPERLGAENEAANLRKGNHEASAEF